MRFQRRFRDESVSTESTNIGSLTCVCSHVQDQRSPLGEASPAICTFVRFFPSMSTSMLDHLIFLGKTLPADLARVWFVTGVSPHVEFQLLPRGDPFAADVAYYG